MDCPCDENARLFKKHGFKEIGTSNRVESDFLPITGLDMTEKIDFNYLDTDSTRMPNDELERVDGEPYPTNQHIPQEPYGEEPAHEPYLSEYYPEQELNIANQLQFSVQEAKWDESKHPRATDGRFGSKSGSDRNNDSDEETEPKLSDYQIEQRTHIDFNTKSDVKNRIISHTKRDYELIHGEGKWIGREKALSNRNWIEYHNQNVSDHAVYRALEVEYNEIETKKAEHQAKLDVVRGKMDELDPEAVMKHNITVAKYHAPHYLADERGDSGLVPDWKRYLKENYERFNEHPESDWDQMEALVHEQQTLSAMGSGSGIDDVRARDKIKEEMNRVEWNIQNHRISSIEGVQFYTDNESLHSDTVHQITRQLNATSDKMESEAGIKPHMKLEIHSGDSNDTFNVGGRSFRRGASWNKQDNRIEIFNTVGSTKTTTNKMAHELGHGQYDNLIINDKTRTAMGAFHEEAAILSRSVKRSEEITDYFAKYAKDRRKQKRSGRYTRSYSGNLETELFAALAEHQMDKPVGGKPIESPDFIAKYDRLKKDYPRLIKSFETLRGMEGTQFV